MTMETIICPLCNEDLGEFEYTDSYQTSMYYNKLIIMLAKTIQTDHDCPVLAPLAQTNA